MPQASAASSDRGQRRHRAGRQPGEDPSGGHAQLIRADPAGRAGQVEAVQLRDLHVGGIHHHPAAVAVLPVQGGGQDQHVGQPRARDRPAGAVDHQRAGGAGAGGADARREPDRPGERAARHVLDQPARGVGPGAVQDGAGEHGRQEGSRHQGPSQLFHGDRQLRQAVALAAERLGQVQAEQALPGERGPQRAGVERRAAVAVSNRRPERLGGRGPPGPAPDRLRQRQMLLGQGQCHCPPRQPVRSCSVRLTVERRLPRRNPRRELRY